MYGVLDLVWYPTAANPTPPAGQASAFVRGDTYAHVLAFWTDDEQTVPFDIDGTVTAQVRTARLSDATAGDPLADFAVTVDANEVTFSLTAAQTLVLPARAYWDLQQIVSGVVTTLLAGKTKTLDDVTRVE